MATERQRRQSDDRVDDVEDVDEATRDPGSDAADIDALLDEIDEVLEENPEEFVRNYVQKGGQ